MTDDFQYHKILVAVDGSKATSQVLDAAIDSAIRNDASLDILNVTQVDQITDGYSNAVLSEEDTYDAVRTTRERMDDLKNRAVKAGVSRWWKCWMSWDCSKKILPIRIFVLDESTRTC